MLRWWLLGACAGSLALAVEGDAQACGGCFHEANPPAPERTIVTGHRMAFSISTRQTILWDQVQYSGNPSEFAWVLPVLPGATIEASRDEWFAALDAATQPVISAGSATYYPAERGGCFAMGCAGSAEGDNTGAGGTGTNPVQVLSQGVVGPYETVTLQSTDPTALTTWLTSHSFDIPQSIAPTLDHYVTAGFDFIALRLRPQCGVNAMEPVRILTPGADPTLPLRMVAAGAGSHVDLVLWVLGEGRWHPQNFPEVTVQDSQLTWSATQSLSNYEPMAVSLMAQQSGTSWLTEFAQPVSQSVYYPSSYAQGGAPNPSLAQAYYAFCGGAAPTNGSTVVQPPPCPDAGAADPTASPDASDDDDADAGGTATAPGGSSGSSGGAASGVAATCDAFDDLSVALDGIAPDSVWLTRMRASLPVQALGTDLVLAAAEQAPISNVHTAVQAEPQTPSPSASSCESSSRPSETFGTVTLLTLTGAALGAMLRRRRRTR